MVLFRPFKEDRRALLLSSLSPPSDRCFEVQCAPQCFSQILGNACHVKPLVRIVRTVRPASLAARSVPLPPACSGQHVHGSPRSTGVFEGGCRTIIVTCHAGLSIPRESSKADVVPLLSHVILGFLFHRSLRRRMSNRYCHMSFWALYSTGVFEGRCRTVIVTR